MNLRKLGIILVILTIICSAVVFVGCDKKPEEQIDCTAPFKITQKEGVTSSSLFVNKVEDLPDDFIMGMDASSVISLENAGVKYFDFDGVETDVFKVLADNGVNTIRVRVWNNPFDENGNGFGGGNCDINTAIEIGKRANKYGMNLMVDFHYSDFWADPAKQMVPRAWKNMDIQEKTEALYQYTKESLNKLKEENVKVSMVQIGNETNGKLCGETKWFNMVDLLSAGSKAVREVLPNALVVLHFANPEKVTNYKDYASKLAYYEVDYDVFASSYYPYWHGTLDNLKTLLGEISTTYNKKVMVAETSYAFTSDDSDFYGNTIGDGGGITKNYPFTIQGQSNCIRDVIDTVAHTTGGIGVCYWEGTWISAGGNNYEENFALWQKYGCGWASSYASKYDPDDAGKYYGGCAVDNQAFFTSDGKPLESLKVFALAHKGNIVDNKPDALEDVNIVCDLNGTVKLPTQVNAVMLDDSKKAVDVVWDINESKINEMKSNGPKMYTIVGVADGMNVNCYVDMIEFNFLVNNGFEENTNGTKIPTGWSVNAIKNFDELHVEEKATDALKGTHHFHFWGAGKDSVEFTLEQKVENLETGTYKYSISIMGGDAGETEIYAYVKINGEITITADLSITSYGNWDTAWINDIDYNGTDEIIVGIYVKCGGDGNGAWGKIDDALFNSVAK